MIGFTLTLQETRSIHVLTALRKLYKRPEVFMNRGLYVNFARDPKYS